MMGNPGVFVLRCQTNNFKLINQDLFGELCFFLCILQNEMQMNRIELWNKDIIFFNSENYLS